MSDAPASVAIAAVCGSNGRRSANRDLLAALVARAWARADVRVRVLEPFDVADVPPFDPDRVDAAPASVDAWRAHLDAADAVVFATPEYAAGIPGTLKNALDWLVGAATLYGKPVLVLSAGTSGGAHVLPAMAATLGYHGAQVVATYGLEGPRACFDDDGRLVDASVGRALDGLVETLLAAVAPAGVSAPRPSTP